MSSSLASPPSFETSVYLLAIRKAARSDADTGGGRLLGHLFCRYMVDVFSSQALAGPYKYALGQAPMHLGGENVYEPLMHAFDRIGDAAVDGPEHDDIVEDHSRAANAASSNGLPCLSFIPPSCCHTAHIESM